MKQYRELYPSLNTDVENANPFSPPSSPAHTTDVQNQTQSLAMTGIVFCLFTLLYLVVPIILTTVSVFEAEAPSFVISICLLMMIVPILGFAGSLAILKKRHYRLARLSAICMMTPLVGPCFGLTLPIGLWALVYLNRKDIRQSFADDSDQIHIAIANVN